MINELNEKHKWFMVVKNGKEVERKSDIYLYAHNGKGFDSYIIMHDAQLRNVARFKNIIKNGTGILSLTIEMSNSNIHLMCTAAHLSDSLKKLCKNFNVPEDISKDNFNIM